MSQLFSYGLRFLGAFFITFSAIYIVLAGPFDDVEDLEMLHAMVSSRFPLIDHPPVYSSAMPLPSAPRKNGDVETREEKMARISQRADNIRSLEGYITTLEHFQNRCRTLTHLLFREGEWFFDPAMQGELETAKTIYEQRIKDIEKQLKALQAETPMHGMKANVKGATADKALSDLKTCADQIVGAVRPTHGLAVQDIMLEHNMAQHFTGFAKQMQEMLRTLVAEKTRLVQATNSMLMHYREQLDHTQAYIKSLSSGKPIENPGLFGIIADSDQERRAAGNLLTLSSRVESWIQATKEALGEDSDDVKRVRANSGVGARLLSALRIFSSPKPSKKSSTDTPDASTI